MNEVISLKQKLALFEDYWSPRNVAKMNDYVLKLAKLKGAFTWHQHADTDEVFIVILGSLDIQLRDGVVHLEEGELFVVPRGVEHRPVALSECHVMLIEPEGVINTGDQPGALTAPVDQWI